MFKLTDVAKHLLIINVVVFLLAQVINLDMLMLYYPSAAQFKPFQIITYGFMHSGIQHILFNMLGLVMMGSILEQVWGGRRFFIFYMICLVCAGLCYTGYHYYEFGKVENALALLNASPSYDAWNQLVATLDTKFLAMLQFSNNQNSTDVFNTFSKSFIDGDFTRLPEVSSMVNSILETQKGIPMLGASGAVYGLLLAVGAVAPEATFILFPIPIPVKAKYMIPLALLAEYYFAMSNQKGDNVAHVAHIAGAMVGAIVLIIWYRKS